VVFTEICAENQVWFKADKNSRCFTWRPMYIYDHFCYEHRHGNLGHQGFQYYLAYQGYEWSFGYQIYQRSLFAMVTWMCKKCFSLQTLPLLYYCSEWDMCIIFIVVLCWTEQLLYVLLYYCAEQNSCFMCYCTTVLNRTVALCVIVLLCWTEQLLYVLLYYRAKQNSYFMFIVLLC
jgi:hypothetical protein